LDAHKEAKNSSLSSYKPTTNNLVIDLIRSKKIVRVFSCGDAVLSAALFTPTHTSGSEKASFP
jgi:hypothetical protein